MDGNTSIEAGKIFVGGLSWETTKEGLKDYFSRFGEVTDTVIMIDAVSRKPRGFGFVIFADHASVEEVAKVREHVIDNKKVDPKPATVKTATVEATSQASFKKVFLGGLASTSTEEDVRSYFSQYDTVTDVDLKYDKATSRMRGFGFVTFESEEAVERVCQVHYHQISGKTVEVKKAEPRHPTYSHAMPHSSYGGQQQGYADYGGAVSRGGNYGGYTGYYGYGGQQQQQQQQQHQQQYGYGYGASGYSGQGYPQFPQTSASYDRGFYNAQQTGTTGQQQGYGQDSSGYGRTGYAGTEAYSGTHATAGYSYDSTAAAAAANSFQQYGESQATGYGRGVAAQQRSMGSYQQQQQQQPYANTH